ncbi:hypothetical protein ACJX0J_040085 [Zea mays]
MKENAFMFFGVQFSDYTLFMFYLFALQESQIFYIILLNPIFSLHPDLIYSEIYFGLGSGSEGIFIKTGDLVRPALSSLFWLIQGQALPHVSLAKCLVLTQDPNKQIHGAFNIIGHELGKWIIFHLYQEIASTMQKLVDGMKDGSGTFNDNWNHIRLEVLLSFLWIHPNFQIYVKHLFLLQGDLIKGTRIRVST